MAAGTPDPTRFLHVRCPITSLSTVSARALLLVVLLAVASRAVGAGEKLGPDAQAAVSALAEAIKRGNSEGVDDALEKIRRLEAAADAIPILIAGLDSENREFRQAVALALAKVRPTTRNAISALIRLLADDDSTILTLWV